MVKHWLSTFIDLVFPRICFFCGRKLREGFLCESCSKKIVFLTPPLCKRCSAPLTHTNGHLCKSCKNKPYIYDRLISVTYYKEPLISLLHLFKYKQYDFLKDFFSSLMITHLKKWGFNPTLFDCIVNVPSHPLRIREREYNQTGLLAQNLAKELKLPLKDNILQCTKYRLSQTKVSAAKRLTNTRGIFSSQKDIAGMRILLVDDVVTTRATVSECSNVLKNRGAENITVLTLTRAG